MTKDSLVAARGGLAAGAVIYQVYPRSFADSDGDGVGDLKGVASRLDHIAGLGVEAVWLSPFFPSPMADFGYDVSDHCGVDPVFGTLADFDALVARAHDLGLKVIIDQVCAHTSDRHPWFAESRTDRASPRADWYVWADARADGTPPNNWQSVFGGPAWTWDARRGQYYLHNFLKEQPQLNLHRPAVQDALLDVARFWLDRGVDGFRLDAINFALFDPALTDNPPAPPGGRRTRPFDFQQHLHNQSQAGITDFLERLRAVLDEYGGRFTVAEVVGDDALAERRAFAAPGRLSTAYGFDFLYAPDLTAEGVRRALSPWLADGWPAWAFSNHDAPRAVSRWAPERDRDAFARMALMLLMSLRGDVFLYQGEELGLPQAQVPFDRLRDPEAIANWPLTLGRDGARTPMPWRRDAPHAGFSTGEPWLPVDPRHPALAADAQAADPGSILNWTRRLIALRGAEAALGRGDLTLVDAPAPLIAFERSEGGRRLLCLFNPAGQAADWPPPPGWRALLSANEKAGAGVAPYAGLILERSDPPI